MKKGIILSAVAVGLVVIYAGISSIDAYFNRPTGLENYGNRSYQDRGVVCYNTTMTPDTLTATELASLETTLNTVLLDEYKARAEYVALAEKFSDSTLYYRLINAETMHINALSSIFDAYDLDIPSDTGSTYVVLPTTIDESYQIGVNAEVYNISLYENYLKLDLPAQVERVFTNLMNASEHHLATFTAYKDGTLTDATYNSSNQGRGGMMGRR